MRLVDTKRTGSMATMEAIMASLPCREQGRLVEMMREAAADLREEAKWDEAFASTQDALAKWALEADKEISANLSEPLALGRL